MYYFIFPWLLSGLYMQNDVLDLYPSYDVLITVSSVYLIILLIDWIQKSQVRIELNFRVVVIS